MLRRLSRLRPALRFGVPLALIALIAASCSKVGDPILEPDPEETSPVPTLSPRGDTAIVEGNLLEIRLHATDPKGLGLVYQVEGNGSLDGADWSWRPGFTAAGPHSVRIIAHVDGHPEWADTLYFKVTVLDDTDPAPWIENLSDLTLQEGVPFSKLLTAQSPRQRGVTYSIAGPPGAAITNASVFAWTPSYTQAGRHEVLFTVTEQGSQPLSRSQSVFFTVLNVDRPPVLQATRDTAIDTGQTLRLTFSATDPDGDPVFYSMPGRPAGSSLNGAVFEWKPVASQAGANALRVIANAEGLSDTDTVVVTVNVPGPSDPPVVSVPAPAVHWSFDNATSSAAPSEPGGRPIALSGGVAVVNGVSGTALRFNGASSQYGESQTAFPDMTEQTLAAWVYVDSLDRTTITLIQESNNASGRDNELSIERPSGQATWKFMYRTRDDDGRHFSNGSLEAKKWYYLAGVATRDTVRLYINGALDRTLTTTGPYNLSGNHYRIQLARKNDGSTIYPYNLRGVLDEIKLFDKALTAAQIQAEWNRHKAAAGY